MCFNFVFEVSFYSMFSCPEMIKYAKEIQTLSSRVIVSYFVSGHIPVYTFRISCVTSKFELESDSTIDVPCLSISLVPYLMHDTNIMRDARQDLVSPLGGTPCACAQGKYSKPQYGW